MGNVNSEIRELRERVQNLADMMQHKIKDLGGHDGLEHMAEDILHMKREDLVEMARKMGRELRHFVSEKREKAQEVYEAAEKNITTHPFQSVAAAVSGGLLLGMIMRRR